jgi:hypothetical protein
VQDYCLRVDRYAIDGCVVASADQSQLVMLLAAICRWVFQMLVMTVVTAAMMVPLPAAGKSLSCDSGPGSDALHIVVSRSLPLCAGVIRTSESHVRPGPR